MHMSAFALDTFRQHDESIVDSFGNRNNAVT